MVAYNEFLNTKRCKKDKKVKLVALKLRKYVPLWRTNLCTKRTRECKDKIKTWEKMKAKVKGSVFVSFVCPR